MRGHGLSQIESTQWFHDSRSALMSRFLNLDQLDPYDVFGAVLRRSRLSMETA